MYEIMVSDEEAPYVVARGNYYVIQSMLPEINPNFKKLDQPLLKKEYSSDDDVLNYEGTYELLKKNGLLDISHSGKQIDGELLR